MRRDRWATTPRAELLYNWYSTSVKYTMILVFTCEERSMANHPKGGIIISLLHHLFTVEGVTRGATDTSMGEVEGATRGATDTSMGEVEGATRGATDTSMGEVEGVYTPPRRVVI
jgi:hypothetical protein